MPTAYTRESKVSTAYTRESGISYLFTDALEQILVGSAEDQVLILADIDAPVTAYTKETKP